MCIFKGCRSDNPSESIRGSPQPRTVLALRPPWPPAVLGLPHLQGLPQGAALLELGPAGPRTRPWRRTIRVVRAVPSARAVWPLSSSTRTACRTARAPRQPRHAARGPPAPCPSTGHRDAESSRKVQLFQRNSSPQQCAVLAGGPLRARRGALATEPAAGLVTDCLAVLQHTPP